MGFDRLIQKDKYQVFLLSCPPSMPLSFARHPWFVVNKKGVLSRYEVIASPEMYDIKNRRGHLCIDALPLWRGLRILRSMRNWGYIWPATLHGVVEGGEGSLAQCMAEFIEQSPQMYPYCERYAYTSPNSNTYAQWVINHFPDSGLKLPWNAFGKNFKENTRTS
jgi:hypothetical protein